MGVSKNKGTQQPWVFLLKMIILGCFGVPLFLETPLCLKKMRPKKKRTKNRLAEVFLRENNVGCSVVKPLNSVWATSSSVRKKNGLDLAKVNVEKQNFGGKISVVFFLHSEKKRYFSG